jgi:uncharacterized protein (TIGR02145 family)
MKISWPFVVFPCRFATRKNNGVQGVETLPATSPRRHCDDIATTGQAETLQAETLQATSLQNTINRLNKTIKKIKMKQLLIFISFMCAMNLSAQVTIGKLAEPHIAAVLDLSQVPSQKLGLLLPPVELEELDLFNPPLATAPDLAAIGMVVYNTKDDFGKNICPGVHVWDGNNWNRLSTGVSATVLNPVRITTVGGGTTFCGGVTFKLSRPCDWSDDEWNALTASHVNATLDGSPCSGIFTKNGDDYYYFIQSQTTGIDETAKITVEGTINGKTITPASSADITISTPAFVAESCFTISGANSFDVYLTNITAERRKANFDNPYPYTLSGLLGENVSIESVAWSYASPDKVAIDDFQVIATGATISSNKVNVKYLTDLLTDATITSTGFKVTIMATVVTTGGQCGAKATYVATREVTIKDADCCTWVADVDGNIYSAVRFGTAGCWMTENLAVTKNEKLGVQLDPANLSSDYERYYPHYTSPSPAIDGSDKLTLDKAQNSDCYGCGIGKPGLLYNWAAAVGAEDETNTGTTRGARNTTVYPSRGNNDTTLGAASRDLSKTEDICPVGWYLPSDEEWHALENEIHKNHNKYSSVSGTNTDELPIAGGYRGTQNQYMRAVNDVPRSTGSTGLTYPGASNPKESGFNALVVGYANGGWYNYGGFAYYWSSSSYTDNGVWCRYLGCGYAGVGRGRYEKYSLRSVRCKKLD